MPVNNRMNLFSNETKDNKNNTIVQLFHGSTRVIEKPLWGYGSSDNDYGSGFYLTPIQELADAWASSTGENDSAIVSCYEIDLQNLNVLNLDDYDPLAWISEIAANRGVTSSFAEAFISDLIEMYKVDTSGADVIIGYRADDSYGEVVRSFCEGKLTIDEVTKLFYKGSLGVQYFLKSKKAFDTIRFLRSYTPAENHEQQIKESQARQEVFAFLNKRELELAKRLQLPPITIIDAITDKYVYNKEYKYYSKE